MSAQGPPTLKYPGQNTASVCLSVRLTSVLSLKPLHGIMRLIYHMKGLSPGIVQNNYFLITVIAQPAMRKKCSQFWQNLTLLHAQTPISPKWLHGFSSFANQMKGLGLGIVQKIFFFIAVIARRVMRETLRNSPTFAHVDTHFSKVAVWILKLFVPY